MENVVFLQGRYENVNFVGQDKDFICEGDLKLVNCTSNGRIFCTGNLICYKGIFHFIDVNSSAYISDVTISELIHVQDKLVAIDSFIRAVSVTGDVTFINSVCKRTAVYDGDFKAKRSEIRNLNRSQSIESIRIKDSKDPKIYSIRL